jgi:hypothetical protein
VYLFKAATISTYLPDISFLRAQGFAELADGTWVHQILLQILVILTTRELVSCMQLINEEGGQRGIELILDVPFVDVSGLSDD